MQSVHAGTRLLRVGPCCRGSILGTISDPFGGQSSLLYSFVGARGVETGSPKSKEKIVPKLNTTRPQNGLQKGLPF